MKEKIFHYKNFRTGRPGISAVGYWLVNFRNERTINFFKKNFKDGHKIKLLEIGPGKGMFAELCIKNGIEYLVIEGEEGMAKDLSDKNIKVINGIVPPFCVNKKFDIIYMNQVFEHMDDLGMAKQLLSDCIKNLNNGGLLYISCPEISFWKEDFFACDYTHNFPTSLKRLEQMFYDFDLKIISKGYCAFIFSSFLSSYTISFLTRIAWNLGVIKLLFPRKAYKVKCSLLPSFIIIGKKNDPK
jgi:SAM-dependent methyltransferase